MKTDMDIEAIGMLDLEKAILFYSKRGSKAPNAFATVHNVKDGKIADDGKPLDLQALKRLLERKSEKRPAPSSAYLPEEVLAFGGDIIAWWKPAHVSPILFKGDVKEMKAISGAKVPHPSLVFVASNRKLGVFAVKGDARPTPDTELFEPPYWNIFDDRRVCLPSGFAIPKDANIAAIEPWERVFFRSHFSHAGGGGGTSFPGGHNALWSYLAARRKKRFPDWCLEAAELKLKDVINGDF